MVAKVVRRVESLAHVAYFSGVVFHFHEVHVGGAAVILALMVVGHFVLAEAE